METREIPADAPPPSLCEETPLRDAPDAPPPVKHYVVHYVTHYIGPYARRYATQIGLVAALALALIIAYACLASSGDDQIYGASWLMETWHNRRPHLNQSITLSYCHLARDTAAEIHWLQQARSLTGEDATLNETSRRWRDKHCIVDASALMPTLLEGSNALQRAEWAHIVNFSARYAPRISSAILDLGHGSSGRLLYPVTWMDHIPGHAPMSGLIDHNVLCITLEEMTLEYAEVLIRNKIEEEQIKVPCFCPIHLGIVGSGLHFIHSATKQPQLRRQEETGERETPCRWNILVDARPIVGAYTKESYEKVQRQHVLSDIFEWEKRILGSSGSAEPVVYNAYATLQAYNLAPLLGADQDFRWVGAAAASRVDSLGERLLLLRDLQSMRVYTVSVDAHDNPNACFQHCQRLELMVLGEHYDADNNKFTPMAYTPIASRIPRALPVEASIPAQIPLSVRDLTDRTREERQKRLRERQETRQRH